MRYRETVPPERAPAKEDLSPRARAKGRKESRGGLEQEVLSNEADDSLSDLRIAAVFLFVHHKASA